MGLRCILEIEILFNYLTPAFGFSVVLSTSDMTQQSVFKGCLRMNLDLDQSLVSINLCMHVVACLCYLSCTDI